MRRSMLCLVVLTLAVRANAAPLTADDAVKLALQHNTQIVSSEASVLTARAGMWSAYSGVLPHVVAGVSRSGAYTPTGLANGTQYSWDAESYGTTESVTGSWGVGDVSAWSTWSSARSGMKAAACSQANTRAGVALQARTQFYGVVQAMHLAGVNAQALRVARDNEKRVRAMYEVGSVSKSDVLKAEVATSQAVVDSLTADHAVTTQRIALASLLGMGEASLGEVDSSFAVSVATVDAAALLAEARRNRPDLCGAAADLRAAELALRSARWSRLPSLSLSGGWTPDTRSTAKVFGNASHTLYLPSASGASESKGSVKGAVALNWNAFDGFATDARVASARARLLTSQETHDALTRNLEGEVHQVVLGYQEAVERLDLARRTVASAAENQNLVQQKYNVGSATILDLIDSQVQLQRAQSSLVSAQAAIRIAEAQIAHVRGRSE